MKGLVSTTFTLEQKSGFKLERNKDLIFIVIIIDMKKIIVIIFWAILPSPIYVCAQNASKHRTRQTIKTRM